MEKELAIRREAIHYTPRFARPAFELWGAGGKVVRHLYDALSPFGATLASIQVSQTLPDASGVVFTVSLRGNSSAKFAFDRIEIVLNSFSTEFFQSIPKLFRNCTEWIKHELPEFKFATHNFAYYCHAFVKESTTKEILDAINPKSLKSAGSNLGNGTIFHFYEVEKNWQVRILFDHSLGVPGALFVGLVIDTTADEIDYDAMLVDGRVYLQTALAELGLRLPEFAQE
jgi:hypothetical protein